MVKVAARDPIRLEIYKHLFSAIADEMGVVLQKASLSPNIKERRDFSCAVFDPKGRMIAQASHIPVHLGSMPLSVAEAIQAYSGHTPEASDFLPGDMIILNDPYRGGTHLPDITLVSPVFMHPIDRESQLIGFVASRAHHADVGGISPGSMPLAREIYQEGLIIPPIKLFEAGRLNKGILDMILANVRTPIEREGDLWAQIAANRRGTARFIEMVARYSWEEVETNIEELIEYTERMTRRLLAAMPDGTYQFTDYLDDDGYDQVRIPIRVVITINGDQAVVDFSDSAAQLDGGMNAVYAITHSAVYYVFRSLIGLDVPNNSGCLAPIRVIVPQGSVVNANRPAPVAGGNVETSQRIVDVLLGALAKALPAKVPAASQGTMNNITIGGWDPIQKSAFSYYETVGGGMGARPQDDGLSAIHSHMTNTLNTPIEALEYAYPLRVLCYQIRRDSGGEGRYRGGDGIRRDILVLTNCQLTLLTERRVLSPYGLAGGEDGKPGENVLIRDGLETRLPGKCTVELKAGDIISIRTPGGGGYGLRYESG